MTDDLGKGSPEHRVTPPQESVEEESEFISDREWEKIIFAKSNKTASNDIVEDESRDPILSSETNQCVKLEQSKGFEDSSREVKEEMDETREKSPGEDTKSSEKLGRKTQSKIAKLREDESPTDQTANGTETPRCRVPTEERVDVLSTFRSKAFARSCPAVAVFYPSSNRSENNSPSGNEEESNEKLPSCEDIEAPRKIHFAPSRELRLRNAMKFGKPEDVVAKGEFEDELDAAASSGGKGEEDVEVTTRDMGGEEEVFEERLRVYVKDFVARKVAERQRLKREEVERNGSKLHLHSVATSVGSELNVSRR